MLAIDNVKPKPKTELELLERQMNTILADTLSRLYDRRKIEVK